VCRLGGHQDLHRVIDVGRHRRKSLDDDGDLIRVDAPHARIAQLVGCTLRRLGQPAAVFELRNHTVRRRDAGGMAGG